MPRLYAMLIAVSIVVVPPASAHTVHTLFDGKLEITLPDSYESFGKPNKARIEWFVSISGYGALNRGDEEQSSDEELNSDEGPRVGDWMFLNQSTMLIVLVELVSSEPEATASTEEIENESFDGIKIFLGPIGSKNEYMHNKYCESSYLTEI